MAKEAKVSRQQSNYCRHTMGLIQPLKLILRAAALEWNENWRGSEVHGGFVKDFA